MLNNQIVKCSTSGFLTGFGTFSSLPINLTVNVASVLYFQMHMIACAAYLAGMNLEYFQTETLVYACLIGVSLEKVLNHYGFTVGDKVAKKTVNKISGKVLIRINQKIALRLMAKFSSRGLLIAGHAIPVLGALVCGGLDLTITKKLAKRSYAWFMEQNYHELHEHDEQTKECAEIAIHEIQEDIQDTMTADVNFNSAPDYEA